MVPVTTKQLQCMGRCLSQPLINQLGFDIPITARLVVGVLKNTPFFYDTLRKNSSKPWRIFMV